MSVTKWFQVTRGTGDINNPYVLQLTSGRILCAFGNHSKSDTVYTHFRITLRYSDDSGVSWEYLPTVDDVDSTSRSSTG